MKLPNSEFVKLVEYLELMKEGTSAESCCAAAALNWQDDDASVNVPLGWCNQLKSFINQSEITARNLIRDHHIIWHMPKLLNLPREYEKIFTVIKFIEH